MTEYCKRAGKTDRRSVWCFESRRGNGSGINGRKKYGACIFPPNESHHHLNPHRSKPEEASHFKWCKRGNSCASPQPYLHYQSHSIVKVTHTKIAHSRMLPNQCVTSDTNSGMCLQMETKRVAIGTAETGPRGIGVLYCISHSCIT